MKQASGLLQWIFLAASSIFDLADKKVGILLAITRCKPSDREIGYMSYLDPC